MTKAKMQHKVGLLNLYIEQIKEETSPFMVIVLREAITKLGDGIDPFKVENWVIKLENDWKRI